MKKNTQQVLEAYNNPHGSFILLRAFQFFFMIYFLISSHLSFKLQYFLIKASIFPIHLFRTNYFNVHQCSQLAIFIINSSFG